MLYVYWDFPRKMPIVAQRLYLRFACVEEPVVRSIVKVSQMPCDTLMSMSRALIPELLPSGPKNWMPWRTI